MNFMQNSLAEAVSVLTSLEGLAPDLARASSLATETLKSGNKLLVCGNGGSACEAQHLAGELVGRYKRDRRALAAIALNADGATMSCIRNDYRFEEVYSRQLEALGRPGDLLVVFTTRGQSPNVLDVLKAGVGWGFLPLPFSGAMADKLRHWRVARSSLHTRQRPEYRRRISFCCTA
jgi:D-sedoheptulose 7-phosphate isomerase